MNQKDHVIKQHEYNLQEKEKEIYDLKVQYGDLLTKLEQSILERNKYKNDISRIDRYKDELLNQIDLEEIQRFKLDSYLRLKKKKINQLLKEVRKFRDEESIKKLDLEQVKKNFFKDIQQYHTDLQLVMKENKSLYEKLKRKELEIETYRRKEEMLLEEQNKNRLLLRNLNSQNEEVETLRKQNIEQDEQLKKLIQQYNRKNEDRKRWKFHFHELEQEHLRVVKQVEESKIENSNLLNQSLSFENMRNSYENEKLTFQQQLKNERKLRMNLQKENLELRKQNVVANMNLKNTNMQNSHDELKIKQYERKIHNLGVLLQNMRVKNFQQTKVYEMDINKNDILIKKLKNRIRELKEEGKRRDILVLD